jgi:hypothetical protein
MLPFCAIPPEGLVMGKMIAISLCAAAIYVTPTRAEPANVVAPSITKINNDATLRAPHLPPPLRYDRAIRVRPGR